MPNDEQLRKYVSSLPPIYREILESFPRIAPYRRQGDGLAFQTIDADFEIRGKPYDIREIMLASENLERNGLVEVKNRLWVKPTENGERLIAIVAGEQPAVTVDPLPAFPA